jgi:hypothetical protein
LGRYILGFHTLKWAMKTVERSTGIGAAILAILLGVSPVMAQVESKGATQQVALDPAVAAKAMRLAEIMTDKVIMLDQAKRIATTTLPDAFRQEPSLAQMEKSAPGVIDAMIRGMLPIMLRHAEDGIPDLRQRYAAHVGKVMTADEMDKVATFYSSPLGRKLMLSVAGKMNADEMVKEAMAAPGEKLSREALMKDVRSAAVSAVSELTSDELAEVAKFGLSPAGRKFTGNQKALGEIVTAWTNESTKEEDAELEDAVTKAIADHLEGAVKEKPAKRTN